MQRPAPDDLLIQTVGFKQIAVVLRRQGAHHGLLEHGRQFGEIRYLHRLPIKIIRT